MGPGGIKIGDFGTDAQGEIFVVATNSQLALAHRYFVQEAGGVASVGFGLKTDLVIGREQEITVKQLWSLPQYEYVLHIRSASNEPLAGAHLSACLFDWPCGAGCGLLPTGGGETDASGTIRFRSEDLRRIGRITVIDEAGKERNLSNSELRELLSTRRLNMVWQ